MRRTIYFLATSFFLLLFPSISPCVELGFLTSQDQSMLNAVAAKKALGRKLKNFVLIDQDSNKFELKDFFDKPFIITFIYTSCPVICPNLLLSLEDVVQKAGERFGRDFRVITVAFDVENDKPEILKSYGKSLTKDLENWKFVTTKRVHEMRNFTKQFGFRYKKSKEGWDHLMLTTVVGKGGIIMASFFKDRYSAEEALKAVDLTEPLKPAFSAGLKTLLLSALITTVVFSSIIYFYILTPLRRKKEALRTETLAP